MPAKSPEALSRKRETRKRRRTAKAAAPIIVPAIAHKPNKHTIRFTRQVEMTKAEMYEMLAEAAKNTARLG
mgnify:CR=1 FL=1